MGCCLRGHVGGGGEGEGHVYRAVGGLGRWDTGLMVGKLLHLFIICFVYVKVETVGWIDVRLDFKVVTKVARRKKVLDGEMQRKERKW
jgi:hypothetical protein